MKNHLFSAVSSSSLPSHIGVLRVDVPLFIPEVNPAGGLRFAIDLVQLFLARILSFFHMFTFMLFGLWLLPIMLASCNRAFLIRPLVPLLCSGCCPRMIASCNQAFRTLTSATGPKVFFLFENERFYTFGVVSHRAFAFLSYVEGPAVAHVLAAGRATVSPLPPLSPLPVVLDMALLQQPLNMSPKGHNMTVQFYTGMGKSRPGHK